MAKITIELVKKLRERTGAGIIDCRNELTKSKGDIELAIKSMRISGAIKVAKKSGQIAADGVIKIKHCKNYAVILEINCQTDFVAKDNFFRIFSEQVLNTAYIKKINDIIELRNQFEEERIRLITRIGENINIRRITLLECLNGCQINSYQHGTRIGVIIITKGISEILSKKIAMHIAASKPEVVTPNDISPYILKREYQLQMDISIKSSKTKEIAQKIVDGRIKKFIDEMSLTNQDFIFDTNQTVGQILQQQGGKVINFTRFEVGEGFEEKNNHVPQ